MKENTLKIIKDFNDVSEKVLDLGDPLPDQPINRDLLEAVRSKTIGNSKQYPNFEFGKMSYGDVWKDLLVPEKYKEKYYQDTINFDKPPKEPSAEQLFELRKARKNT